MTNQQETIRTLQAERDELRARVKVLEAVLARYYPPENVVITYR